MRVPLRKIARGLVWTVAGLLLLICLAVGGALLWLRTGHGEKTVAALAVDVLAEQGIRLDMERLSGPLPFRIFLRNVRLADGKGEWFAAREVEVHFSLTGLLLGTVTVPLVRADTPEIYRLPDLPPSEEAPQADGGAAGFSLPMAVRVDNVVIENAGVYAPLLFPDEEPAASPLLRVSGRGAAWGKAAGPLEIFSGTEITADLSQLAGLLHSDFPPVTEAVVKVDAVVTLGREIAAKVTGTATAEAWETPLTVAYSLDAALDGSSATVREAVLDGLGLRLAATAEGDINALTGKAEATFAAVDNGQWQTVLEKAAGQRMGGAFTVSADASLEAGGKIEAALAADGSALRWPTEQLQALLGNSAVLRAKASGGGNAPYAVTLESARAGSVSASGKASVSPDDARVAAEMTAALKDIAPLVPDAAGALAAKAEVSGTLSAPVFSLEVTSDTVTTASGVFQDVRAGISGDASLPPDGVVSAQGRATLSLGQSPAGPARLGAAYAVNRAASGEISARVHDADVDLAGVSLMADVTATIPAAAGAAPSLDGRASATIVDWRSLAALTGVPLSGSGAGFDAVFSHNTGGQTVTAELRADSLALKGDGEEEVFSLTGLTASLDGKNLAAEPDVALAAGLGKGSAGPFLWQTGALRLVLQQGTGNFALAFRGDNTAKAALDAPPGRGAGAAPAKTSSGKSGKAARDPNAPGRAELLTVAGDLTLSPMAVRLTRLTAGLPDSPLGVYLARPSEIALGDTVRVRDLDLRIVPGDGGVTLEAVLAANDSMLNAAVTDLPFRLIKGLTGAPLPEGSASLTAALTKRGAAVQGSFDGKAVMDVPGKDAGTSPAVTVAVNGTLDDKSDPAFPQLTAGRGLSRLKGRVVVNLENSEQTAAGTDAPEAAVLAFNAPVRFSAEGAPRPDMDAPLGATLAWKGDIAPVWALAPVPDRSLSGLVQIDASLSGTLARPAYTARAYMGEGRFEDSILGVLLTGINLEAESSSSGESKIIARVEDGQGGFAALEGRLLLPEQAAQDGEIAPASPRLAARGHISHLQPLHRDDLFVRLSGRFTVDGDLTAPKIVALAEVERGELSLLASLGGVTTLDIENPEAPRQSVASGPVCDIQVSVPGRFFIRGRGLESEWRGDLAVSGPLSSPSLTGSLHPVRGTFDFLSRTFSFERGDITFFGGDRINPALNLALTYSAPNIIAVVRAMGTASKPDIRMESRPPLPQDQILAAVLFGKDFSNLSRFEALQVANSLRQLTNIGGSGGGLDPLTTLRTSLGVDMLRLGSSGGNGDTRSIAGTPGADSLSGGSSATESGTATPTVEAGKYINDAIYVGVEQGAAADSTGVRVEVELRPNLSLQGRTTSRSSSIGLGWKRDY